MSCDLGDKREQRRPMAGESIRDRKGIQILNGSRTRKGETEKLGLFNNLYIYIITVCNGGNAIYNF